MPVRNVELWLHEEILLLALTDEKGTVDHRAGMYAYAMAGAAISELLRAGRLGIEDERKRFLVVADERPVGEPLLDELQGRVARARRRERLQVWVTRVAQRSDLRHRVAAGLCERGVLRETEVRILLVFPQRRYPQQDPRYERAIRERLMRAVQDDRATVDPRTATLLALLDAGELLSLVFDRQALRQHKERIRQIATGQLVGRGTKAAVQAAQAAVCAATTAAIVAATSG